MPAEREVEHQALIHAQGAIDEIVDANEHLSPDEKIRVPRLEDLVPVYEELQFDPSLQERHPTSTCVTRKFWLG